MFLFGQTLPGFGFVLFYFGFEASLGLVPVGAEDDGGTATVEDFVGGGEWAVFGVEGDVVHRGLRVLLRRGLGEVVAGDLEGVEEESGAAGVEVVGGYALNDLADGGLDGGSVLREREVEGASAGFAAARVLRRLASGVVVVAEVFVAETGGAATVAVDEDVAALEALGLVAGC